MWQPLKNLNWVSLVQYRAVRWKIRYVVSKVALSHHVHPPDNLNTTLSAYQRKLRLNLKQNCPLFFGLGSVAAQMAPGQTVLFVVFDELDSFNLIRRCELNGTGLPKERLHLKTTALGNNPAWKSPVRRFHWRWPEEMASLNTIALHICSGLHAERIAFHSCDVWFYYCLKNEPNKCSYWFAH